jgi:hypothetical protein
MKYGTNKTMETLKKGRGEGEIRSGTHRDFSGRKTTLHETVTVGPHHKPENTQCKD